MSVDYVSSTVDLVRLSTASSEKLNKARDAVSLMLFGRTFSTAKAASSQGKLPAARVDRSALIGLSQDYGSWILAAANFAERLLNPPSLPCKSLSYRDILDICRIAENRERVHLAHISREGEWADTLSFTGMQAAMPLRNELRNRLAKLGTDALIELKALVWLGRGDAPRYDLALSHAKQNTAGDVHYLAAKAPLHTYLRKGVEKLSRRTV